MEPTPAGERPTRAAGIAGDRLRSTVVLALVAGLGGSLADSLAGATMQASYRCEACGEPAETPGVHCEQARRLVRGYAWVTNDAVNALATLTGAILGTFVTVSSRHNSVR